MNKIIISVLNSVNGVKFGSDKSSVHNVFGDNFKNYEDKELSSESIDYLMKTAKEFAEMTGRPLSDFTKYFTEENPQQYGECQLQRLLCALRLGQHRHFRQHCDVDFG